MAATTGRLRAGAAQVSITPGGGVHLSGAVGAYRPAKLVADPLYAKAVVFEQDGRKLCFLALDVTIVCAPYTRRIREVAARELGFDPDAVLVHATQTHSAPSLGYFMVDDDFPEMPAEFEWVRGSEAHYGDWAVEQAIEAIRLACGRLEPVCLGMGSGIEGRMAHNRRAVMRDGKVTMPGRAWPSPLGPTEIRYLEGPIDPEVGVVCVRRPDLSVAAFLLHHTCHPVHVFPKLILSADWPGAWGAAMARTHGADTVSLVLNGACGNINPWPPFDPDYPDDHHLMGDTLAAVSEKVLETLEFTDQAALDWRVRHLKIPLREVPRAELDWARGILERQPQPAWADAARTHIDADWTTAASIYSVHLARERDPNLDYEVQVLRLGDLAVVGLPGEPFVEGGLRLKIASPTYPTYVAHCTSHYVGYIPTREALHRGGHEVNTRYWAKLVPEALDQIVDGATEVLREVFGGEVRGDG
ncbi:MAG: hypothetical protein GX774_13470 [Armatimonadetes bacterium]|nr:hypothetical protein [Armatimonadota bacterium]